MRPLATWPAEITVAHFRGSVRFSDDTQSGVVESVFGRPEQFQVTDGNQVGVAIGVGKIASESLLSELIHVTFRQPMADRMGTREGTVKAQRASIMEKLGASSPWNWDA